VLEQFTVTGKGLQKLMESIKVKALINKKAKNSRIKAPKRGREIVRPLFGTLNSNGSKKIKSERQEKGECNLKQRRKP